MFDKRWTSNAPSWPAPRHTTGEPAERLTKHSSPDIDVCCGARPPSASRARLARRRSLSDVLVQDELVRSPPSLRHRCQPIASRQSSFLESPRIDVSTGFAASAIRAVDCESLQESTSSKRSDRKGL